MVRIPERVRRRAGKVAVFCAALVVAAALVLAAIAGTAEAKKKKHHPPAAASAFLLNVQNAVLAISSLVGDVDGPLLRLDNNGAGDNSTGLDLQVEAGKAPITVNPEAGKATNLDADKLDGLEPSQIQGAKAYALVYIDPAGSPIIDSDRSSGFTSAFSDATGQYCLTAPSMSSDTHPAVVSVDWSSTVGPAGTATAMVGNFPVTGTPDCPDGGYRVVTKRTILRDSVSLSGKVLDDTYENNVGFVIAVL